jgi:hypothetical protein
MDNQQTFNDRFMQNTGGFNVERLIEFGMSAAIAGQVIRTMNDTMGSTMQQWPASMKAPAPVQTEPARLYYAALEGKQAGPFSETEIVRLIGDKRITKDSLVWHQGMAEWKKAEDVPEILRVIALSPPPLGQFPPGAAP